MCYLPHDIYIGRALDLYGEFSQSEVELFEKLVRPGMSVVEVGSNIGCHTVPLARLAGVDGYVHAYEPQRILFQMMCANIAMNGLCNVISNQKAVGDRGGSIGVPPIDYSVEDNFGGVELVDESPDMVPLVALDDEPIAKVSFLKIDVEGMEASVIRGAAGLIKKHRPIMYVENDREEKSDELIKLIMSLGYDLLWDRPALFNADNYRQRAENEYQNIKSYNMLCIPSERGSQITKLGIA